MNSFEVKIKFSVISYDHSVLIPCAMLFIVSFVNMAAYFMLFGHHALGLPLMLCSCDSVSCFVSCVIALSYL